MQPRVIIEKVRAGYVVKSYDFTTSIYSVFEEPGSLHRAVKYCKIQGFYILNLPSFISLLKEGGPSEEVNIEGSI